MTSFIYGVLGMLLAILLFAGGVAVGWCGHIKYLDKTKIVVQKELSEQEKKRQKEEAQAFGRLVNFSPEMAYGIVHPDDLYDDSDKE